MSRDAAGRDVIGLVFRCAVGSLGAPSTAESVRLVGRRGCSTSSTEPFIVPGDVGVHDVSDAISYVVWLDVDGLDVVRRIATEFRRAS